MSKHCAVADCTKTAFIRIQPLGALTWRYYCNVHWLGLALAVVDDAERNGLLDKIRLVDEDTVGAVDDSTQTGEVSGER